MNWPRSERGKTALLVSVTVIIALAMVWINTYQRCRREYLKGEKYLDAQDYLQAITSYETAIHAYTPFNSMIPKSALRLWEIALNREQEGDLDMALISLRSLRSSFFAVRSLYTPYPEWITRAEEKINELIAHQEKDRLLNKKKPGEK